MVNFPTALDTFSNPGPTDLMDNADAGLDHDVQHSNANDAIEALQAKVGIDASAVTSSLDYLIKAAANPGHTHTEASLSGVLPLAGGVMTGAITFAGAQTFDATKLTGDIDLARIPATLTAKDADTLDTYHATSFLLKAGGTMAGNLSMNSNTLSIGSAGTLNLSTSNLVGGGKSFIQYPTAVGLAWGFGHITDGTSQDYPTDYGGSLTYNHTSAGDYTSIFELFFAKNDGLYLRRALTSTTWTSFGKVPLCSLENTWTALNQFTPTSPAVASAATNYIIGINVTNVLATIAAGITDSGYRYAIRADAYVADAGFYGTLGSQVSGTFRYGLYTSGSSDATITAAYGLNVTLFANAANGGTITTAYGLCLAKSGTGVTITNEWGVYQNSSTAMNAFYGTMRIGSVTAPDAQLAVTANEINAVKVTSYTATVDADATNYISGLTLYNQKATIAAGKTDSGYRVAQLIYARLSDTGFYGTLATNVGLYVYHGIQTCAASGERACNMSIGIGIYSYSGTGSTITTSYALYIQAATTLGTVTNDWAIYQASATQSNAFAGNTRFGGTTAPTVAVDVTGTIAASVAYNASTRQAMKPSYFGYSSTYRTLILGSAGTTIATDAVTLCFGVDVVANTSGSFSGNGSELIFRNSCYFKTVNSTNDNYISVFAFADGKVGLGPVVTANMLNAVEVFGDMRIQGSYKLTFGGTTGAADVELYRSAANVLYTPDTLKAGGYQSSDGTAGATKTITVASTTTITVKNGLITASA